MMTCTICGKENLPDLVHCVGCGALLMELSNTTEQLQKQAKPPKPDPNWGEYQYNEDDILYLLVEHKNTKLSLLIKNGDRMILGRRDVQITKPNPDEAEASETIGVISKEERRFLQDFQRNSVTALFSANLALIDLGAYDGYKLGVSRRHALLERQDQILYLTDLQSANGVYLNNTALTPYQKRILRDQDALRLGMLKMIVYISAKEKP